MFLSFLLLVVFWHGANFTFIFWGLIHALFYIPLFISAKRSIQKKASKRNFEYLKIITTFILVMFSWVIFRSDSISGAFNYIQRILTFKEGISFFASTNKYLIITGVCFASIIFLILVEIYNEKRNRIEIYFKPHFLIVLCLIIAFLGAIKNHANFIYFQF